MNGISIAGIYYTTPKDSSSGLASITPIPEGQVLTVSQQISNEELADKIGTRNRNGLFNIPTDREEVWLPFLGIRTILPDPYLAKSIDSSFTYFTRPEIVEIPLIVPVKDGDFFRCAGDGPKPIEEYQYYLVLNGAPIAIPNYKTLEVLLYERGKSLLHVKVLEQSECMASMALVQSNANSMEDKTNEWSPEYEDLTSLEKFQQLAAGSAAALALAATATSAVQAQIDAANTQSAATQAAALASSQQAMAAQAAASAAQQQAQAAIAEAASATAAANAEAANALALQAELALQLASLPPTETQP